MSDSSLDAFLMPEATTRHEIDKIKGSRFIATLVPVRNPEEADETIQAVRADFPDARHTCFAWRLDKEGRSFRASDDGEPAGSAGRPILKQIEGRELACTLIAVTRYFGGTKLGVGGLMRAYGGAAAAVLEVASYREVLHTDRVRIEHPYECSSNIKGLLSAWRLEPKAAEYTDSVSFELDVPHSRTTRFIEELVEATAGRARAVISEESP